MFGYSIELERDALCPLIQADELKIERNRRRIQSTEERIKSLD
jgi:hypothetical protein